MRHFLEKLFIGFLTCIPLALLTADSDLTYNQQQIMEQLDNVQNPSADLNEILTTLSTLSSDEAQKFLDLMSGQQYTHIALLAEQTNELFIKQLYSPLRRLISSPYCNPACHPGPNYDFWLDAAGNRSFFRGNPNARGFKNAGFAISGGAQSYLYNDWTIGMAGSYEQNHISYNLGGSSVFDTGLGGIYALYRPYCYYLFGDLVLGHTSGDCKRPIEAEEIDRDAKGRIKFFQTTLYLEAGWDLDVNCYLLQPFFGIELGYYNRNRLQERNADSLNLIVKEKDYQTAYTYLGLHVTTFYLPYTFLVNVDAAWKCRLTQSKIRIREQFEEFGDSFTIKGADLDRNLFEGAVNITKTLFTGLDLYCQASLKKGSRETACNLFGGLIVHW